MNDAQEHTVFLLTKNVKRINPAKIERLKTLAAQVKTISVTWLM